MHSLHSAVDDVALFYPRTVKNYCSASVLRPRGSERKLVYMTDAAERLVSMLIEVLSRGLREEINLWAVLETLRLVPGKIAQRESSKSPLRKALYHLNFCGQFVYVARSLFVQGAAGVRAAVLLRLMLNQGALLAALELIGRWNALELTVLYAERDASVLCNVGGALWDSFVRVCAPVGGMTLTQIVTGAKGGRAPVLKFDMMLVPQTVGTGADGGCDPTVEGDRESLESGGEQYDDISVWREMETKESSINEVRNAGQCEDNSVISGPPNGTTAARVELLLNEAEAVLFARWRQLEATMSVQEALLFEASDGL